MNIYRKHGKNVQKNGLLKKKEIDIHNNIANPNKSNPHSSKVAA
jgi:hypothetical protein